MKKQVTPKSVDEYLGRVPEPARSTLNKIRGAIRSAVPPEATETISYRILVFKYKASAGVVRRVFEPLSETIHLDESSLPTYREPSHSPNTMIGGHDKDEYPKWVAPSA